MKKHRVQFVLFCVGVGTFGWVLYSTGLDKLSVLIPALSGPGIAVLLFYPFISLPDAWGWYLILSRDGRLQGKFADTCLIRLAGEGLNTVTPVLDIGGEFLKVSLASRHLGLPRRTAVASVVLTRSALLFSEVLFWILGLSLIFALLTVPGVVHIGLGTTLAIFILICVGFIIAQVKGLFATLGKIIEPWGLRGTHWEQFEVPLKDIDDEISHFYGKGGARLARVILLHYAGWMAGSIETYAMLFALGVKVSVWEAVILEAVLQMVRSGSFFIPASLGIQEGGLAIGIQAMGVHPAFGVALSLLKRIRQLVWAGVGFGIWGYYQWRETQLPVKTA